MTSLTIYNIPYVTFLLFRAITLSSWNIKYNRPEVPWKVMLLKIFVSFSKSHMLCLLYRKTTDQNFIISEDWHMCIEEAHFC